MKSYKTLKTTQKWKDRKLFIIMESHHLIGNYLYIVNFET